MDAAVKHSRIMKILESETGGKSYKSHKYSLEYSDGSAVEYGDVNPSIQWKRRGETKEVKKYVFLADLSAQIGNELLLLTR